MTGDFRVRDGQTVVCIGDSITDCGRRGRHFPLGDGYVSLVVELATSRWPERRITWRNRGISGDVASGLRDRWGDDVVALEPDWLSVLIGINDLHRRWKPGFEEVSPDAFHEHLDACLARTREQTDAKLLLMDPFYISTEHGADNRRGAALERIGGFIEVVRELAAKYETLHVPLHDIFQRHLEHRTPDVFCPEPIHPNRAGHVVMAEAWLEAMST